MPDKKFISLDTETFLTQPGLLAPKLVCMSLSDGKQTKLLERERAIPLFEQFIKDPNINLVGHRIAYDLAVFAAERPDFIPLIFKAYEDNRIFSTDVRQQLIDIALGSFEYYEHEGKNVKNKFSLAQLSQRYLGELMLKGRDSWQLRFNELDGLHADEYPAEACKYAIGDAEKTLKIFFKQEEFAGEPIPTESLQTKAAWALHLMGVWGIRTDPQRTAELRDSLLVKQTELKKSLQQLGLMRDDGTMNQKLLRERVVKAYNDRGLVAPLTDSGQNVSIDKETLKDSGDPELELVYQHTHVVKYIQTYIALLLSGNSIPFNPSWNVLVESGRTSCGGETAGNLQNLPREIGVRECIAPRAGNVFSVVDYNTAELRSLGQMTLDLVGFSVMADELNRGLDPHLAFAADRLGITYEQALANKHDPAVKHARSLGKIWNFGAPGGMSPPTMVYWAKGYGVSLTEPEARDLSKTWKNHYREMPPYFSLIGSLTNRDLITYKHPRTGFVRGKIGYTQCLNHNFQHLTATGAKEALWEVSKECYTGQSSDGGYDGTKKKSPLFGSRPTIFCHDEILLETCLENAHEASYRQAKVMCDAMSKYVVDVKNTAEPTLSDRYSKDAKTLHDDSGRLQIWTPK